MKHFAFVALLATFVAGAQTPEAGNARLGWAFLTPDKQQPPAHEESGAIHIPGSTKEYTAAEIDNLSNPPDWFPGQYGTAPSIVQHAKGAALACGSCHLMSGHGHQESADLAGLPVDYIVRTMNDFKSGARIDPARMNVIAKAMSEEEIRQAAEYFAALKPGGWIKVVETDTVPKSYVAVKGRQRLPLPNGGTEPLGDRIIELPQDIARATSRDPAFGIRGLRSGGQRSERRGAGEDRRREQNHRLRDLSRRLAAGFGRCSADLRAASGVCRAPALWFSDRHQSQRVVGADEESGRESYSR